MKEIFQRKVNKVIEKASFLKGLFFSCYTVILCFAMNITAYASGNLQSSEFYMGTLNLLNDSTTAINILAPLITIIVVVYYFARKSASDEHDYRKWDTRIKIAIICGVGIETASLLINLFVSYYQ